MPPSRYGVDTNVLATRLLPPSKITPFLADRRRRVGAFFTERLQAGTAGVASQTVFREFLHLAIRSKFMIELNDRHEITGRNRHWEALFKEQPELLARHSLYLRRLPAALASINVTVLQPEDLEPTPLGQRAERMLSDVVDRYRLNTNDASILIELRQAGIDAIVTEDADLRRAASDFQVYTWL